MEIGAQLYTVRESCQTLDDLALTLRKVADIGYRTVQVSGTCGYDPHWLKEQLDRNGLKCVLTHTNAKRIREEAAAVAQEHAIFGCDYVGLGSYGFRPEKGQSIENFFALYRSAAQELKENGKYFMYHNHAREFIKQEGKLIFEWITEGIPAEYMGVTLDTYWVQVGGADPAQWLERLAGRIPCIHLKDCAFDQKMAAIGDGNMNFDRILEKAEAGGTKYLLVEQDDCYGKNPFDSLKRSYDYLKACGLQ